VEQSVRWLRSSYKDSSITLSSDGSIPPASPTVEFTSRVTYPTQYESAEEEVVEEELKLVAYPDLA
jgi:hypothetical protein